MRDQEPLVVCSEDERIKELTKELCSLDCKDSRYRLRSEQILFEINKIVKNKKTKHEKSI